MDRQQYAELDHKTNQLRCQGDWILTSLTDIQRSLKKITFPRQGTVVMEGGDIQKMDSAGAWVVYELQKKLTDRDLVVQFKNFNEQSAQLMKLVGERLRQEKKMVYRRPPNILAVLGKTCVDFILEFNRFLSFTGRLSIEFVQTLFRPWRWRFLSLFSAVESTGFKALPIIALLSFMIGIVISYQMGNQLRNYGANVFIVNLLGLSVLREFGPLITAIMVAGRTGSAFTAQLGIMKINQEIDALDTMGVTSGELLLLPRLLGLLISLPLLTVWADIFGVFGGMVMANNMLGISWFDFLARFQHEIPLSSFIIGVGKAPIFALLIGSIGCFEGMQVHGSAESVGKLTTRSVVLGIFFIIIADAIFSVIFSKLQL